MLNFSTRTKNEFIIYADGVTDYTDPYFIIALKNGATNVETYSLCDIEARNSRFIKLSLTEVALASEDPLDAKINLSPIGNWDYTLYNGPTGTLNPINLPIVDQGQMQLISGATGTNESQNIFYISDNESFKNKIYLPQ
jgi:hypothetical protein